MSISQDYFRSHRSACIERLDGCIESRRVTNHPVAAVPLCKIKGVSCHKREVGLKGILRGRRIHFAVEDALTIGKNTRVAGGRIHVSWKDFEDAADRVAA